MGRDAEDPDAAAGMLDHCEDVETGAGQRHSLEEVRGDDGLGLGAQECRPGGARTLRCRIDTGVFEDLPDRGGGDLHAEDEQFAVDGESAWGAVTGFLRFRFPRRLCCIARWGGQAWPAEGGVRSLGRVP